MTHNKSFHTWKLIFPDINGKCPISGPGISVRTLIHLLEVGPDNAMMLLFPTSFVDPDKLLEIQLRFYGDNDIKSDDSAYNYLSLFMTPKFSTDKNECGIGFTRCVLPEDPDDSDDSDQDIYYIIDLVAQPRSTPKT